MVEARRAVLDQRQEDVLTVQGVAGNGVEERQCERERTDVPGIEDELGAGRCDGLAHWRNNGMSVMRIEGK